MRLINAIQVAHESDDETVSHLLSFAEKYSYFDTDTKTTRTLCFHGIGRNPPKLSSFSVTTIINDDVYDTTNISNKIVYDDKCDNIFSALTARPFTRPHHQHPVLKLINCTVASDDEMRQRLKNDFAVDVELDHVPSICEIRDETEYFAHIVRPAAAMTLCFIQRLCLITLACRTEELIPGPSSMLIGPTNDLLLYDNVRCTKSQELLTPCPEVYTRGSIFRVTDAHMCNELRTARDIAHNIHRFRCQFDYRDRTVPFATWTHVMHLLHTFLNKCNPILTPSPAFIPMSVGLSQHSLAATDILLEAVCSKWDVDSNNGDTSKDTDDVIRTFIDLARSGGVNADYKTFTQYFRDVILMQNELSDSTMDNVLQ